MKKSSLYLFSLTLAAFALAPIRLSAANQTASEADSLAFPTLKADNSELSSEMRSLKFESTKKNLQTQLTQAKRKKKDTSAIEEQIEICDKGINALRATNKVVFIDSIVVDKQAFLSAYKFDDELGTITMSADNQLSSYTSELGTLTYRTEKTPEGTLTINAYFIEEGKLIPVSSLSDLELDGDINYPFLQPDGSTLYFASRSTEGHGNYDLYVTRYDAEDASYLTPTNLGYPFNSYANDYMMVIDDNLGIGWFASDRHQPVGKVCIYTFLQPKARHTYDYEADDMATIINAAKINSIKDTWRGNEDVIRSAHQALTLKQNQVSQEHNYEFTFVVNNNYTYHNATDFKNPEARKLHSTYNQKSKELEQMTSTLSQLRSNAKGATIRSQILNLEKQVIELNEELGKIAKEIRRIELN